MNIIRMIPIKKERIRVLHRAVWLSAVKSKLSIFILAVFCAGLFCGEASALPRTSKKARTVKQAQASGPECKAKLLIEFGSGEVIFEENSREALPPASMVKTMLLYIVMKKLDEGIVKLEDVITTSAHAAKIGGSQVYLKQGEQFTLEQLFDAVVVHSSNDASTAIAEHIGGSSEGFVDLMNMEAEALGLKESSFTSPHGLPPAKGQDPDLASAYDLAQLARVLIQKYPKVLTYSAKPVSYFRDGTFEMINTNKLVRRFSGCDGLKTGYYGGAGFGVIATAMRNGVRMISVVMGCQNGKRHFDEAARLLSLGFSQYKLVRFLEKGAPAAQAVPVLGGEKKDTVLTAAAEFVAAVKPADQPKVERKESLCPYLPAPVAPGTPCGKVSFVIGERELGAVDMITAESIPALSLTGKILRRLYLK